MTPSLAPLPRPTADAPASDVAIHTILLATDLSPTTDLATDWAFALASRHRANLLVVSVIDPRRLRLPGGRFNTRVDQVRARREEAARRSSSAVGRSASRSPSWSGRGSPGSRSSRAAEAEEVDLLLVGAHGRGAIGRLVLGSVSEYVARHAPCPVLVVRAPRAARGPQPDAPTG